MNGLPISGCRFGSTDNPILSFSYINSLNTEATISIRIIENGKAVIISMFCKASSPPLINSMVATVANTIPHVIFILFDGFSLPFSDSIASTTVAESADVMKYINTKISAITDNIIARGYWLKTPNNIWSIGKLMTGLSGLATFIANDPNIENHTNENTDGTTNMYVRNSLIVRPFDIFAMKTPTNGDQDIHHAQ